MYRHIPHAPLQHREHHHHWHAHLDRDVQGWLQNLYLAAIAIFLLVILARWLFG
jgi:hypothetical protein